MRYLENVIEFWQFQNNTFFAWFPLKSGDFRCKSAHSGDTA